MKYFSTFVPLCLMFFLSGTHSPKAQTVQILSNSTLNGAVTGVVLGGAGMIMTDQKVDAPFTKNMDDLYALQVGLGLGILYGMGSGVYDVASSGGRELLVSGFFNDATNSSAIVLMDTFYGAASGTLISAAITLLSSNPNFGDVKYGLGVGVFIGFGFGIFDSYVLASRSTAPATAMVNVPYNTSANGLATIQFKKGSSVGFVNPSLIQTLVLDTNTFQTQLNPAVEVLNVRVNF